MSDFLNQEKITEIAEKIYHHNKNSTLWDVMVSILAEAANIRPYVIWILSDFPILEAVSRGYGLDYIRDSMEVKRQDVIATCRTWGLFYWTETLDFDPLLVYDRGTTVGEFRAKLESSIPIVPSDEVLENCINNVEKYHSIKELLDEWENERRDKHEGGENGSDQGR